MVGAPLATELAAADVTELAIGVDETATEDAATDDGARLLASAIEDVALDAGADPPPLPPPPPQAVINPLRVTIRNSLDVFINRSLVIIDLPRYYALNRLHSSYSQHVIKSLPFSIQTPLTELS